MDFKAGMFVYALAFLLGIVFVQQLSVLPDILFLCGFLLSSAVVCVLLYMLFRHIKQGVYLSHITLTISFILLIIIGVIYASVYADRALSYRLDKSYVGKSFIIKGRVSSIPVFSGRAQRFEFDIESYQLANTARQSPEQASVGSSSGEFKRADTRHSKFPQKVRLSWYYGKTINAGETWQLEVRLKPPHGFMNPGGFDYEAWLFQHGIHASGYVRKSTDNKKLQAASAWSVNANRQFIAQLIDQSAELHSSGSKTTSFALNSDVAIAGKQNITDTFALIKALAIGDKSSISAQQWQVLTRTGTSHLMAISGLHIGLASLFAFVIIRRLIPASVMKYIPAQHIALFAGMLVALLYALLAGLSVPTQRAIIMLFTLSLMVLMRRNIRPLDSLGFALLLVLLFDPLAVLSAGFWFSFSAVAVIFICVINAEKAVEMPWWKKTVLLLKQWVRLQLIISVFLLPLSLYMFQQGSLISPLANLLLIPYVSFLVVPVVLLAIIFTYLFQAVSVWLFELAAWLLDIIWPVLSYFSQQPYALWVNGEVDAFDCLLASSAMLIIFFAGNLSTGFVRPFIDNWNENRRYKRNNKGMNASQINDGQINASRINGREMNKTHINIPRTAKTRADNLDAAVLNQTQDVIILWSLRLLAGLMFVPLFVSDNPALAVADYQVVILDVGQGSAAVVQTQNHVLVFDTGARFSDKLDAANGVIIPYLNSQNIRQIDRLIISHGDSDHIGGAQALLDAYPEMQLIGQDIEKLQLSNGRSEQKQLCLAGLSWQWDGVTFSFLSPIEADLPAGSRRNVKGKKRNNHSCVLHISSVAGSILFTGDIEKKVEKKLLRQNADKLASDILIVPHHGSNTSSSKSFVSAVKPKISIISAGYKNRYKLPASRVIDRYKALDYRIINTANMGAITISLLAGEENNMLIESYRQQAAKYWNHRDF